MKNGFAITNEKRLRDEVALLLFIKKLVIMPKKKSKNRDKDD